MNERVVQPIQAIPDLLIAIAANVPPPSEFEILVRCEIDPLRRLFPSIDRLDQVTCQKNEQIVVVIRSDIIPIPSSHVQVVLALLMLYRFLVPITDVESPPRHQIAYLLTPDIAAVCRDRE